MTLIKLNPLRNFELIGNNAHNIFGEFPSNFEFEKTFSPKIDISEDEKNYYFEAEIPGTKMEDLNITIENNILTIKGEKKFVSKGEMIRSERVYGAFTRTFNLIEDINPDTASAEFENGTLRISIEKAVQKTIKERQIKIK